MKVRTRFAPSPTGYLHVGGARTALYAWLFAHKHQGDFILRIEDTDVERSTDESVQAILDGMAWLNLDYEGPYYQSQHTQRYQEVTEQLLQENKAYRCYCSKLRLEQLRQQQIANKQKPRYDGHCRDLKECPDDQPYVVRFRNPQDGVVRFDDQIRGIIEVQNSELDDLIITRSDGTPTYNFTVVVDDFDMRITHVIRGDDHINNTPRQINILHALGMEAPLYAHLPMILGDDGKRLSKRHGAVSVMQFRDDGLLPQALLNYLVRLGWAHGDQEIFSVDDMKSMFDIKAVHKAPAIFNTEKLLWLNQHYIKTMQPEDVAKHLAWHMQQLNLDVTQGPSLTEVVKAQSERCKTLKEMAEKSQYFYVDITEYDEKVAKKHLTQALVEPLTSIKNELATLTEWTQTAIHDVLHKVVDQYQLKFGKIAQPLRVAMTGNTVSPSIDITLLLIGKDRVIKRIERAIAKCQ